MRRAGAKRQSVLNGPIKSVTAAMGIPDWNDGARARSRLQEAKGVRSIIAAPDATRLDDIATETFRADSG